MIFFFWIKRFFPGREVMPVGRARHGPVEYGTWTLPQAEIIFRREGNQTCQITYEKGYSSNNRY